MENKNNAYRSRVLSALVIMEPAINGYMHEMAKRLPETFMHSIDVAYLAGEVAYELGLEYVRDVVRGALIHDVGKLWIPTELLLAPGRLTADEKTLLKSHAQAGYDAIASDPGISEIAKDVVLRHHEKQDGSGYPSGLKASELGKAVKIVTVCDIYDAMTKERPYHKAFSAYETLNAMASEPIDKSILKILKECPDR